MDQRERTSEGGPGIWSPKLLRLSNVTGALRQKAEDGSVVGGLSPAE